MLKRTVAAVLPIMLAMLAYEVIGRPIAKKATNAVGLNVIP